LKCSTLHTKQEGVIVMDKNDLFFNLCALFAGLLFIAGIGTAIMYPVFGCFAKFITMLLLGFVLLVITAVIVRIAEECLWGLDEEYHAGAAILFFAIGFFFLSWHNIAGHGYSAVTANGETKLVEMAYFNFPYDKDFVRIADKKHDMTVNMETDKGFIVWDVSIKLELIASYDEAFELLARHGGADQWLDKVEKVSKEAMEMVVAENASLRNSGWFSADVPKEYKEQLGQMGYEIEEIWMGNLQYVQSISQQ
jgi:uncharacterized membrane protein YvlD (DUF360 family)